MSVCSTHNIDISDIVKDMQQIGCFKTGSFVLKSGVTSDFYIDMRTLISYPEILKKIANIIAYYIKRTYDENRLKDIVICGIAYGAIPLASLVSSILNIGMIIVRKEKKEYGTSKQIEGDLTKKECILLDDVITSGTSIKETQDVITQQSNLKVIQSIVIVKRGEDRMSNVPSSYLMSVDEIKKAIDYLKRTPLRPQFGSSNVIIKPKRIAYNSCANRLLDIINEKKTNLIVSIDESNVTKVLSLTNDLKDYVCGFKYHSDVWDIIDNVDISALMYLKEWSMKHNFIIFEDRKFADIGETVNKQFVAITNNYYNKSLNLVTTLPIAGEGTVTTIQNTGAETLRSETFGQMLIAELSTKNNLITPDYTSKCVNIALKHKESVAGFICQSRVCNDDGFLYMTPGVHISEERDNKDQQYRSPEDAIIRDGCDIIIVGRGITHANDPIKAAELYRNRAYECYINK